MQRNLRLSALVAAALVLPGVAAAAETSDDAYAVLNDQELVLPPLITTGQAAAVAFQAAIAAAPAAPTEAQLADLEAAPALSGQQFAADEPRYASLDGQQFASLSEDELGGQRGGFMTPLGMEIGFGAIVRTTIDGALALETQMTWTNSGLQTTNTIGSPTPVDEAAALAAAGGINLGPAAGWNGIVSPGATGGATAVLHDLTNNAISSVIINTANDRVIKQETQINLAIPELAAFQAETLGEQMRLRMSDAVGQALAISLPK